MRARNTAVMIFSLLLLCGAVDAADEPERDDAANVFEDIAKPPVEKKVKLYHSPSERREAGLGRQITDWLSVSGLAEVEAEYQDFGFSGHKANKSDYSTTKTLQLGLNFTITDEISAEFVFEYEIDSDHSLLEEGIVKYEGEQLGIEGGRLFIPFGEYYSHFAIGPILEFGETRGNALVFEYGLTDTVDVYVYSMESKAEKQNGSGKFLDWGGGFEIASEDESMNINAGYFSDLAETDDQLLDDFDNKYEHRVGGLAVNALFGWETHEITAEYVGALRSFNELDSVEERPWAANLEIAWFPRNNLQLAARLEASGDIPDEPAFQTGLSATWLIGYRLNITLDYLYGKFRNNSVFDDNDNEIDDRHLVAAQLSFEF